MELTLHRRLYARLCGRPVGERGATATPDGDVPFGGPFAERRADLFLPKGGLT
jgi:hypothetical protein